MYKLRGIIGFYLTVAVLLAVALMPFEKNIIPSVVSDIAETEIFFEENEVSAEESTKTEVVTESEENLFSEESTVEKTDAENTFNETEAETVTGEILPELGAVAEDEDIESEEEKTELILSQTEKPEYHNSEAFFPNAKIYPLYFFSENTGALVSSDSVNIYTFTLESRSVFQYIFKHKEIIGTAGWNVSLYGEYYLNGTDGEIGYRLLNTLISDPSSTKQTSVKIGLLPGNYRLVVSKGMAYTADGYAIEVVYDDSSEFEIECNDNIYRYTSIYSSVPIKGTASYFTDKQDEDWYMFRQYEDGFAQLKFEHPAVKDKTTVCWQVILYSENGTPLYSVNSLFTDEIIRSGAIGLTKGNYYILVKNRVYTDVTYTLSLSRADDISYETEKNDTMETATEIPVNSTVTGSVAQRLSGIDRDYFRFILEDKGTVTLEFSHMTADEDKNGWNFILTDDKGTVLYKGISAWSDDVSVSSHIGLPEGTYYVLIDSDNLYLNSTDYYLSVSFMADDGWETEPNNSFDVSDKLSENVSVTGIIADTGAYDYDCYSFTLNEESDVSVIFDHELLSEDKNIFTFSLYDGENNPIAAAVGDKEGLKNVNVSSAEESVQADYKALPAGTYYLKVSSGIYYSSIIYSLYYTL